MLSVESLDLNVNVKPIIRKESEESGNSSELVQHKSDENLSKIRDLQTRSEPDFTCINLSKNSPKSKKTKNSKEDLQSPGSDQDKIKRKTAQTYLSNLNQGYIQSFDNLKLINNCLSQQNMP